MNKESKPLGKNNSKRLAPDLRERLAGRIHMDDISDIVRLAQNDDKRKQELYDIIFDEKDSIVINALWIMTHYSLDENKWLHQKHNEMIDKLLLTTNSSQKRLLLSLLYKQPLADPPRVDFLDYCLEEMLSRKEAPGTTTLCLKLAYEMCRTIPELLQEYCMTLDTLDLNTLPPSLRTTKKNIMKAMKTKKSLQQY